MSQAYPPPSSPYSASLPPMGAPETNWSRARTLGIALLVISVLSLLVSLGVGISLVVFGGSGAMASDELSGLAAGSSIIYVLLGLVDGFVTLCLFILAVVTIFLTTERARVGAIIIGAGIIVSIICYWIGTIALGLIAGVTGDIPGEITAGEGAVVYGLDLLRVLVFGILFVVGSYLVHSTAKKKLAQRL